MTTTTDHLAYPPVVIYPVREAEGEGAWESCSDDNAEAWCVYVHPHGRPFYYRTRSMALLAVERLCQRKEPPAYGRAREPSRTVYLP